MRVLYGNEWKENFLPYDCPSDSTSVTVTAWVTLDKISNMYFVPKKNLRVIFNYLIEVGLKEVIKKVISRTKEKYRNDKYVSLGFGWTGDNEPELVCFLATSHPKAVDSIVVHNSLCVPVTKLIEHLSSTSAVEFLTTLSKKTSTPTVSRDFYLGEHNPSKDVQGYDALKGWMPYSGVQPDSIISSEGLLGLYSAFCNEIDWRSLQTFQFSAEPSDEFTQSTSSISSGKKPTAILYGYGQYAKTNIIPNIEDSLSLVKIHEIDPTQIPESKAGYTWSTAPSPDSDTVYDAHFIAGYHHTHADIAIHALNQGKAAVVEKPVVVDQAQLCKLLAAMQTSAGSVYACFHKRYSRLNEFVWPDLGIEKGEPVNYHCIVYEVALPELHWYNWPNSHTRVVSNACHWIDHFLFLNNYPEVTKVDGFEAPDGTVNCTLVCENGAVFTMVLTDIGTPRIGVQEYIELRNGQKTVSITNSTHYVAEDEARIVRKTKVNKLAGHRRMYLGIGKDIGKGKLSDSIDQVRLTHSVMIQLENLLKEQNNETDSARP